MHTHTHTHTNTHIHTHTKYVKVDDMQTSKVIYEYCCYFDASERCPSAPIMLVVL